MRAVRPWIPTPGTAEIFELAYRGDTAAALEDVRRWTAEGRRVVFVVPGHGQAPAAGEHTASDSTPTSQKEA